MGEHSAERPLRVLAIDGGGMRGLYAATYLATLADQVARRRRIGRLDFGAAFDLIVGTSTGGIIACALAVGVPLDEIAHMYRRHGPRIFPAKMPATLMSLFVQLWRRPQYLAKGSRALRRALVDVFGELTVGAVYERRRIALAIPAIDMARHRPWVFKTAHLGGRRDEAFRLVDVCLATTAAPLYRSMAVVPDPSDPMHSHRFVDGGLWANNPVLVGLVDALRMTKPDDAIQIFSLAACPRPPGDASNTDPHRGLWEWRFGGVAAALSLDAQQFASDEMARMLACHLKRTCSIVRFPTGDVPADAMPFLDLDETSEHGMNVLAQQAHSDVWHALSACDRPASTEHRILRDLRDTMPPARTEVDGSKTDTCTSRTRHAPAGVTEPEHASDHVKERFQ